MGLRRTGGNENPRRPRESGDPCQVDSRLRGNDERGLIFRRGFSWACGSPIGTKVTNIVVPAKAGTHVTWIPAFAGMTSAG